MPTDKSKKLGASKPDNAELMEPHLGDDPPLTMGKQDSAERLFTGHAAQWGRILKIGNKWYDEGGGGRHWVRVKCALATKIVL